MFVWPGASVQDKTSPTCTTYVSISIKLENSRSLSESALLLRLLLFPFVHRPIFKVFSISSVCRPRGECTSRLFLLQQILARKPFLGNHADIFECSAASDESSILAPHERTSDSTTKPTGFRPSLAALHDSHDDSLHLPSPTCFQLCPSFLAFLSSKPFFSFVLREESGQCLVWRGPVHIIPSLAGRTPRGMCPIPDLCSSRRTALLLSSPSPSLSELLSDTCRRSFCRWCKMKARRRLYRHKMGGLDSVRSLDGSTWIQSDHVVHWRFRRIMSSTGDNHNQPESRAGKPWQGRPSSQCDNTPHFHQEAGTKIRIRRDVDQKRRLFRDTRVVHAARTHLDCSAPRWRPASP